MRNSINHKLITAFICLSLCTLIIIFWMQTNSFTQVSYEWINTVSKESICGIQKNKLDLSLGQLDASKVYSTHVFTIKAERWDTLSHSVSCLAIQSSVEQLHSLVDVTLNWNGPVSMGIFTPDVDYEVAILYTEYLRQCYTEIRNQVSFHFVYPLERSPRLNIQMEGSQLNVQNCSIDHKYMLQQLLKLRPQTMMSWRHKMEYPQNLMRNTARNTCPTLFVMCPDVDMFLPSIQLSNDLNVFLTETQNTPCEKCAYVIPVYEISNNITVMPLNKQELLELINRKQARPFHSSVFYKNQGLSLLTYWEKLNVSEKVAVSHNAGQFSFWYEPVYVAKRDVPAFDERFIGYGLTRNTQAYEMFISGWKFKILNNIFLIHLGFQTRSNYSIWRKKQADKNFEIFKTFIRSMAVKYDKDPLSLLLQYPKNNSNIDVRLGTHNVNI